MNILSAVVSVARRRHATSSIPDVTASSSSSNNFCNPSHINSELKENKNINNFLRLFQDCGRIPPLTAAANPHFPHVDILHRYGKQASTLIEADVLRSQYIEMFSLPFRAWQEGSKCCTANKESDPTKSLLLNNDTGQKFPHPNSSIASSETTLVNEQLSKRLQRYSAIKQACRHLHTISTPILFCPKTRSKFHSANSSSSSCSSTTTDTTFKTTTSVASTNSVVANSTVSKEDDFSDKLHHHTKNIIEHSSLSSHNRNPTRDPNTTINLIPSSKPNCLKPKQMADTNVGGDRFLSPWLSWSHNAATSSNLDDVGPLSSDTLLTDNNSRNEKSQHNDGHTSVVNFNNWLRRVARQFLVKYSQYLQQEVGFHPIPILNTSVTPNRRDQTVKPNVNYALFHRSIHLAGLHIIELFIRNSRLFVRVGTIEVSRFSWHASRSVTMGPYTSEVISQAAASAAASMTSVMFNAVFRRNMKKFVRSPNLSNVDSPFSDVSALSDPNCSDWMQYSNNLSWNESSKLCDYTHLHSFAYDFHLHAIQDYLGNRRCCHRGQCSDASRRSSSSVKNGYSNVIDIPDYPVTKFLEDLSCLAQKIPLFSRGYLCCFPVTCHVSLCLRPDQVFHHLIEEHASYGVDIVRMSRSECSIAQTNPPYNKHLSYNFALVEQCHPGQESSFRSSSEHQPKYQPSSNFRTFSESHSISTGSKEQSSKYSALGIANAHHIVEDLTKLDRNFSHSHSLPQPYSVTGIVVPDEINGTYSDIRSPIDGSITNRLLHLIVYLIVLDSKHEFPEFRLAKLNSGSCIQCPVDWPAVPPCLDPCSFSHQLHSFHRSPKSFGIEDTDISSLIAEPFFQNFSIPLTTNNSDQKISKHSENTSENDIRWHMSYLSMCPSHQVQLLRVLRISQSILESRITQLIARSGVDCHKNLLWYKLFDTNSSLATQILSTSGQSLSQNTVDSNCQMEKTPSINLGANSNPVDSYVCPVLNHQSLSMREIEELVDSAPFQLDILRLDPRLHELFKVGACHLNTISVLLNREFVNSQQNSHHQTDQMKMNTNPKLYKCSTSETISCIAYRFSHSIEDKMDNGSDGHGECRQCLKNYMVLLSPSFTEGLIFLSWCETSDNCVPSEGSTVHTASGSSTVIKSGHIDDRRGNKDNSATTLSDTTRITMAWNTKKYKDFQFRAVFRAVGDPTNPSSMRRLVDSDIEIQNLFFKTSTLALVATNLIEKLSVLVWRTLHN
ncbi:unnamed protein product [Heterobilharzia americana]|nr:unnamed protein product [Heterobilharzia americana]